MIKHEFIHDLEGCSLEGYVPNPEKSNSGVTISTGYDIGQHNVVDITSMFPQELAKKLIPYARLKKQVAVDFLEENPLTVTDEEADQITALCDKEADKMLNHHWNNSVAELPLNQLSDEQQTVLASVAYQYGDLAKRTPKFWGHATEGNWPCVISELRYFRDAFPTRRNREADVLENGFKPAKSGGGVPSPPTKPK